MKKHNLLFYISCFLGLALFVFYESTVNANKDFDVFINASHYIMQGKSCYNVWFQSGGNGLQYYYSPLFGILIYPLTLLSQFMYNCVWLSLNVLVLIRLFKLVPIFLDFKKQKNINTKLFYALLTICIIRVMLYNFDLGQMTIVLVWASLESLNLIYNKKIMLGAALLALIINIKILPIVVICYLVYKAQFKAVLLTILFFIIYLYIPVLFIGFKFNNQLLNDWYITLTNSNNNSIYEDLGRQSLSSLIPSLFMNTVSIITLKRNIFEVNEQTIKYILILTRLLFLILLIPFLGKPFRKIKSKAEIFYHIALVFTVTPIFFPHQGKYSLFFLLPAYAYCIYTLLRLKPIIKYKAHYIKAYKISGLFVLISFVLITLTTDGLIGRHLSDIAEHYHLLVFGTISLLIGTIYLKPIKNN